MASSAAVVKPQRLVVDYLVARMPHKETRDKHHFLEMHQNNQILAAVVSLVKTRKEPLQARLSSKTREEASLATRVKPSKLVS